MQVLKNLYYSFPVQLLFLHLKKQYLLLFAWLLLFLIITDNFGKQYGIPYLFLDPEYLGAVNFVSFSILGGTFGGFLMTWNISSYLLNSYRFPFLATFRWPFAMYCLNNTLLPLAFLLTYIVLIFNFQVSSELILDRDVFFDIAGFLSGMFIVIFLVAMYFQTTNKDIFHMFGLEINEIKGVKKRVRMQQSMLWENIRTHDKEFRVDFYITPTFHIRHIRSVRHYDQKMISQVFRQNHSNALVIEVFALLLLISLGLLIDHAIFRIPAAASGMLLMAIFVSLAGLFSFWVRGWEVASLIAFLVLGNLVIKQGVLDHPNSAFGLHYNKPPVEYNINTLLTLSSRDTIRKDYEATLQMLENWKKQTGEGRPKMVLMNFSGGGLGAAMFSVNMLQKLDSITNGEALKHTVLMTGASGGMFGAAYVRELQLQRQLGNLASFHEPKYAYDIGKDLLNPIMFTITVNDLFYPLRKFQVDEQTYLKDRGYIMEKQLMENTNGFLDRRLGEYKIYEQQGIVPMVIFSPTISNDERKLLVSAQSVSYLTRPVDYKLTRDYIDIDAVDFSTLFQDHGAMDMRLTSAIRMNGTYPYILPNVTLPTEPMLKVMDAGYRDNYGMETTTRFIHVFANWIKRNTSGVVIVQMRAYRKDREIVQYETETIFDRLIHPISNLYLNWGRIQDYNHNYLISFANDELNGKLDVINFEYIPEKQDEKASLNFHLTTKEKLDIIKSANQAHIKGGMKRLDDILKD